MGRANDGRVGVGGAGEQERCGAGVKGDARWSVTPPEMATGVGGIGDELDELLWLGPAVTSGEVEVGHGQCGGRTGGKPGVCGAAREGPRRRRVCLPD